MIDATTVVPTTAGLFPLKEIHIGDYLCAQSDTNRVLYFTSCFRCARGRPHQRRGASADTFESPRKP